MPLSDCFETESPTGGVPLGLPPCFENSECFEFSVSAEGKISGRIPTSANSVFSCEDGVCLHGDGATAAERLAARVDTSGTSDSLWAKWNPLRRVLNADGRTCLGALPMPLSTCDCAESPGCRSFVGDGADGQIQTGCGGNVSKTFENVSAWPMCVTPEYTLECAELEGGPATYDITPSINGVELDPLCMFSSDGPATVEIAEGGDPAHTHTVTVSSTKIASYSGTVRGAPIVVQPGDTLTVDVSRQVRLRGKASSFATEWGTLRVCLPAVAQVTEATIAQVETSEVGS